MNRIKLSIAIPTLNRAQYLQFTLKHFIPQIEAVKEFTEILIVNNKSEDNTTEVVKEFIMKYDFIRFYDCTDRVTLGEQFKRTVAFSKGEYVILWGDDDLPAPFLVSYLLSEIEKCKNCGLFYFNRLVGYENGNPIKSLTVYNNYYQNIRTIYTNSTKFIADNFWGATFMSAVMFHREVWKRGLVFDTNEHYGFEFMGILYYGNKGGNIIYVNYPLCIQRKVAHRAWGTDWPKYSLLGLPNMSRDLEKEGLFDNGLNIWKKKYNKFPLFCYILMSAATNKKKYRKYCHQFTIYQDNIIRKFLIYIIIYLMPKWVYNLSRKIMFNLKK